MATSRRTLGFSIILLVFSMDGSSTMVIRFSGAPLSVRALFNSFTVICETFFALG